MAHQIVAVGPNCWGKGKSLAQAVARCRNNYPSYGRSPESMPYNAYEASEDAMVDCFGSISATELKRIREVRIVDGVRVIREGKDIKND